MRRINYWKWINFYGFFQIPVGGFKIFSNLAMGKEMFPKAGSPATMWLPKHFRKITKWKQLGSLAGPPFVKYYEPKKVMANPVLFFHNMRPERLT